MTVIPVVVEQHLEEVSSLWLLRSQAVDLPHYTLRALTGLDVRLAAHLDGLKIAAEAGWEVSVDKSDDAGELFATSVLALESGYQEGIAEWLEQIALGAGTSGVVIASLAWLAFNKARPYIDRLLHASSTALRCVGLAAGTAHRADLGAAVSEAVQDEDLGLRARALRAVGELGHLQLLPLVERNLDVEDSEVRFSAAWSTAVLSDNPEALIVLADIVQSNSRYRERALQTAMRRAQLGAAKKWHRKLAQDSATLRFAVQGAGAIGDPAEVPWLLDNMEVPELARVAGESFMAITGVDLAYDDLDTDCPEGFASGPTEDPTDENVEMDPDENLSWPDAKLVEKWWQSNRHTFQPGTRYLLGKPITLEGCQQVLRIGRQRQRAAAALELAVRQPGTPLFEVRAPGFRQKQLLGL